MFDNEAEMMTSHWAGSQLKITELFSVLENLEKQSLRPILVMLIISLRLRSIICSGYSNVSYHLDSNYKKKLRGSLSQKIMVILNADLGKNKDRPNQTSEKVGQRQGCVEIKYTILCGNDSRSVGWTKFSFKINFFCDRIPA